MRVVPRNVVKNRSSGLKVVVDLDERSVLRAVSSLGENCVSDSQATHLDFEPSPTNWTTEEGANQSCGCQLASQPPQGASAILALSLKRALGN